MLIKIEHLTINLDHPGQPVERRSENWIDPAKIEWIHFWRTGDYAGLHIGVQAWTVTVDDARRIIDHINGTAAADSAVRVYPPEMPPIIGATEQPQTLPRLAPEQPVVNMGEFLKMLRSGNYVVLDTETTGLEDGEIVQIAIVHSSGDVLLDTLVKPKRPIPADATRIHGITNEMVKDAPTWEQVRDLVAHEIMGEHVVIYNAVYDRKMMHKSSERWGLPKTEWKEMAAFWCAMEMFAAVYGEWNEYRGNFRWQKLATAADYYNIPSQGQAHTALADCLTTLAVCKAMAGA